jgi:hypothetical protein
MSVDTSTIIEAFVVDQAFINRANPISDFLIESFGTVATLTPKAFSYFNNPAVYQDRRAPSSRNINWNAETSPSIVVDETSYSGFVTTINNLPSPASSGFFKLVDKLLFNHDISVSREDLEATLIGDPEIAEIYVPDSFVLSTNLVEGTFYFSSGVEDTVDVPAFTKFSIELPSGSTTITYVITLFASTQAWITGYDISTIVKVIPPLPYSDIYSGSLVSTGTNMFSTADLTATLNYNTARETIGTVSISGSAIFIAIAVDSEGNTAPIPFNLLYKGRSPTRAEMRQAIRDELADSGVGTLLGWEVRLPGVYITGRFYLVPLWDLTITKPDQILYPSILDYDLIKLKANNILESTGFGDLSEYMDIVPVYYNRMTVMTAPDITGIIDIAKINTLIPDYQNFSTDEDNFEYMNSFTKEFSRKLNQILSLDNTNTSSDEFIITNENLLTFYSFVVGKYEMCVITKDNYNEIMESVQ